MHPLAADLDHILNQTPGLWEELRGQRIFITGGTGFFGCWLLESFAWANDRLDLQAQAAVLTRNPGAFARKAPHLATHPAVQLHAGDLRSFPFPAGRFSHVIHAAIEHGPPLELFAGALAATRRTLDFAVQSGARRYLLTSSGAVYGRQPPDLTHMPEDYPGAPDPLQSRSAYGEAKRASEFLCAAFQEEHSLQTTIARGFAFVGPYLPLHQASAIGNFIADAMKGGPIRVNGDGTPWRSYLYAADLAIWLWTILLRGKSGRAYNVGSDAEISIAELARLVASVVNPKSEVVIAQPAIAGKSADRYVPSIERARTEFGLVPWIDLPQAIAFTAKWHGPLT